MSLGAARAETVPLKALVDEALQKNPEILAAKKRWEASTARIPQAKSLPDPAVGITFEKIPRGTLRLDKTASEDRMLSISQFLPFFGKLPLKGKIAVVESQMSAMAYRAMQLDVAQAVQKGYYDLFLNQKEQELTQESLSLLAGISRVADAQYSVGQTPQEQLYKFRLEMAQLETTLENLKAEKNSLQTRMNVLLNRDPEAPLQEVGPLEESLEDNDIRSLYQTALLHQPEVLIFSYTIEKNRYAKTLAKKSFLPDLMSQLVLRGVTTGSVGLWDLMLSVNVPFWFWTKQRYEIKEAISNLEEAEAAYQAMKNKMYAQVKELKSQGEQEKNRIQLYRDTMIPLLEKTQEVSLSAFQSGQGEFMALLDTRRMLVQNKMDYYRALVAYQKILADLKRALGAEDFAREGIK